QFGVIGRLAALEWLPVRHPGQADLLGSDGVLAQFLTAVDFTDACRRAQRTFIDAILSMNDEGVLAAQVEQGFAHLAQERTIGHTENLVTGMSRVGQRTQDVEHGANANFTTGGANMFHGRMKGGRKHEAKADLLDAAGYLFRTKINTRSQRLQDICTATATGGRTIAVFSDCGTRGCDQDSCCSRDIEGARVISTGAAG